MPKKKPTRKKAPKAKKKPARSKKRAPKKKLLRKKKSVVSKSPATDVTVVEVELVGSTGNLFDDEEEGSDEDFPQEYGGSE